MRSVSGDVADFLRASKSFKEEDHGTVKLFKEEDHGAAQCPKAAHSVSFATSNGVAVQPPNAVDDGDDKLAIAPPRMPANVNAPLSSPFAPRADRQDVLCLHANRLEGVLSATMRELDGFTDTLSREVAAAASMAKSPTWPGAKPSQEGDLRSAANGSGPAPPSNGSSCLRQDQFREHLFLLQQRTARLTKEVRSTTEELQRLHDLT
jgi:hypothetical protein